MWKVIKRLFGALSMFLGLVLICWIGYNYFWPTPEYQNATEHQDPQPHPVQFLMPFVLVAYGVKWFRE